MGRKGKGRKGKRKRGKQLLLSVWCLWVFVGGWGGCCVTVADEGGCAHFQRYDAGCFFLGEVHGKSHPAVASRKGLESLYWRRKVKRRASDKNYLLVLNPA